MADAQARLDKAVEGADLIAIRNALAAGADVNALDDDRASVIFYACLGAETEVVQLLLDEGADPNALAEEPAASILAAAEAMIGEVREDEPELAEELRVEAIEFWLGETN